MRLTQDGAVNVLVAGDIRLPVRGSIYDVIADVKKLPPEAHEAIIRGEGLEVPPGLEDKTLLYTAMSFVQNAWYAATAPDGAVPAGVQAGHETRLADFAARCAYVRVHPPAPKKPPTEVRFKPLPSTARLGGRRYQVASSHDTQSAQELARLIATLRGQRKAIYETVAALTQEDSVSFDDVLVETKVRGLAFSGKDGGRNAVRWHLQHLVAAGLVLLSPAQAEVPGTPAPVVDFTPDEPTPEVGQ